MPINGLHIIFRINDINCTHFALQLTGRDTLGKMFVLKRPMKWVRQLKFVLIFEPSLLTIKDWLERLAKFERESTTYEMGKITHQEDDSSNFCSCGFQLLQWPKINQMWTVPLFSGKNVVLLISLRRSIVWAVPSSAPFQLIVIAINCN